MIKILATFQYVFIDLVVDLFRWPIWWYSKGFLLVVSKGWQYIKNYGKSIALGVWIKNIFVPMYGARDIQSRLISFLVRVVQILVRGFLLLFFIFLVLIVVSVYIALPIFCVIGIILQLAEGFD